MEQSKFQQYRFEELEVWKLGLQIVHETYVAVKKFPRDEIFSLSDQLRRAATSIVLNIAEGSGQPTPKGFAVYLHRSKSSCLECVACIKVAIQENFMSSKDAESLNGLLEKEYFKLIALEKSVNK